MPTKKPKKYKILKPGVYKAVVRRIGSGPRGPIIGHVFIHVRTDYFTINHCG